MDTYWPEGTLADLLDIHIQNYHDDFRRYWHLDAEQSPPDMQSPDWLLARLLDRVGSKMLSSALALHIDPALVSLLHNQRPLESPEHAVVDLMRYAIAQTSAEIELANVAVSRLFEGKRRLGVLAILLSSRQLSNRAAAYVDRMIQCYIWGLDTECTVMARSVLEAALEELFPDERMKSLGFRPGKHGFTYRQYQDAAAKEGLLSDERLHDVNEIRRMGNEAIHAAPGLHPPVLSIVARTILCLRDLFPVPT